MTIVVDTNPPTPSSAGLTFLAAVNRLLRITTVMQWDDDDITSFSNTQHSGTIALARTAIQHVTNDLISDRFLFPEDKRASISTSASTARYTLETDFVRMRDKNPWFYQTDSGVPNSQFLSEWPGGEGSLKKQVPMYETQTGTPQWFYWVADIQIGIYPVPDSALEYRYDYQKDVMPENESDSLPVQTAQMSYAYVDMAARVFTFLFTMQAIPQDLGDDIIYKTAKSALMALQAKNDPIGRYGHRYNTQRVW
jgi:hypothetical protein